MWSYSGDPSTSDVDAVRFLIGDTIEDDPLLTDEEINFTLQNMSVLRAAISCCEAIASKFAREADNTLGPIKESASQKAKAYERRAQKLSTESKSPGCPTWHGLAITETEPIFTLRMMGNN